MITEADLPLVLITSLEDRLRVDLRHGIRAIRARFSPNRLNLEAVVNLPYFQQLPLGITSELWSRLAAYSRPEVYFQLSVPVAGTKLDFDPRNVIVTIGSVAYSLNRWETITGWSLPPISDKSQLEHWEMRSGKLVWRD
ncbi:MAG: hypothetical protein D6762_05285 [Candidatus Neomarinimicrobiota bacterium]|nr:MAG: hypothetical protein D6762_05285 [Candidatus Neomarinimicrobiota bacterium]